MRHYLADVQERNCVQILAQIWEKTLSKRKIDKYFLSCNNNLEKNSHFNYEFERGKKINEVMAEEKRGSKI